MGIRMAARLVPARKGRMYLPLRFDLQVPGGGNIEAVLREELTALARWTSAEALGPMEWAVLRDIDGLIGWLRGPEPGQIVLDRLAVKMEARGLTGQITKPTRAFGVHEFEQACDAARNLYPVADRPSPQPLGFLGYRLDSPLTHIQKWGVSPETTELICATAQKWTGLPDATITATHGVIFGWRILGRDVASHVRTSLDFEQMAAITAVSADPLWARKMTLDCRGSVVLASIPPPGTPMAVRIDRLLQIIRVHAALLDVAMIRLGPPFARRPEGNGPPDGGSSAWAWGRNLWADHVVDAHGVQLLTDAHLANAHDLSDWNVEQVASDRWLVSAHDLAPWYEPRTPNGEPDGKPPAEVLAKARADFGDMILTHAMVRANPDPAPRTPRDW